jgi:hypothetical protein
MLWNRLRCARGGGGSRLPPARLSAPSPAALGCFSCETRFGSLRDLLS